MVPSFSSIALSVRPKLYNTLVDLPLTLDDSVGGTPPLSTVLPNFAASIGICPTPTSGEVLTPCTIRPSSFTYLNSLNFIF